jgi:uncharacterized repeat protein (TIGR01451 family)
MKRPSKKLLVGAGIAALVAATPFLNSTPVFASLKEAGAAIAQALKRPQVKLNLAVEKQVIAQDQTGQPKATWKALEGKASVTPGDVLRYVVTGQNAGESAAKNLVVTQPVSKGTVYVLGSATNENGAKTVYSIDNGKTFVEAPTVQVKLANGKLEEQPAPAEAYTHIRWKFSKSFDPAAMVKAAYQVKVR